MFALPPCSTHQPASTGSRPSRLRLCVVLISFFSFLQISQAQISNNYFGMHMHGGVISRQPWPVDSFGSVSLWDGSVSWSDINSAQGKYDWSNLDLWLAAAKQHNDQLIYTFGRVPQWASSNRYETGCADGPGECAPPSDVNPDGSGTDQSFKDFVTAIAAHNKNSATARITYWELWNEPYNAPSWTGTIAQIVRMAKDATAILKAADPNAVVLVPSVCIEGTKALKWIDAYLAAGGSSYADAVAFHGYVQKRGLPLHAENILTYISQFRTVLAKYGLQGRPLWDTEASWGRPDVSSPTFYDEDMRMGFVAQAYLLQQSAGVARFFWYQWNNPDFGTMWLPNPNTPSAPGTLLKPGVAFGQLQNWMVGASLSSTCSSNGTVWSCGYTRPGGYVGQVVWDTAQSCANGKCTSSNYKIGSGVVQYRTLDGTTVKVTGSSVPVGYKPILLEN
jgi:polysaccharide biosynthesis protein PslG